jgi:FkbM family methyltransferase
MDIYKVDNYHYNSDIYFYILNDCYISNIIKNNQIWEPHLHKVFEKYVNSSSIVIECGCHIGTHTIKLAKLCKKIYGFEPMPKTNYILNMNISLNKIDNAFISDLGVSCEPGKTNFLWTCPGNPGASGLNNNPMGKPEYANIQENIEVSLTTIDSLNLDKLDFIKIDVEGYESLVIKGGIVTISKFKPIIVVEVWKNHSGEVDINYTRDLFKELIDIGYTISHIYGPDFLFLPN